MSDTLPAVSVAGMFPMPLRLILAGRSPVSPEAAAVLLMAAVAFVVALGGSCGWLVAPALGALAASVALLVRFHLKLERDGAPTDVIQLEVAWVVLGLGVLLLIAAAAAHHASR